MRPLGVMFARGGSGGPPPASTYFDLVTADAPVLWWRHGEASGSTMVAQVGTNGSYVSSPPLAQAALYPGGPTTMLASANRRGQYTGVIPPLNALTVECIVRFNAISGFRGIICADAGSGARSWQQRLNGSAFEFVKIVGGVSTINAGVTINNTTTYHMVSSVSATGVVKMYTQGVLRFTSTALGAQNYSGNPIEIGYMAGGGGASADARFSESAIYNYALSDAQVAAHFAASGL